MVLRTGMRTTPRLFPSPGLPSVRGYRPDGTTPKGGGSLADRRPIAAAGHWGSAASISSRRRRASGISSRHTPHSIVLTAVWVWPYEIGLERGDHDGAQIRPLVQGANLRGAPERSWEIHGGLAVRCFIGHLALSTPRSGDGAWCCCETWRNDTRCQGVGTSGTSTRRPRGRHLSVYANGVGGVMGKRAVEPVWRRGTNDGHAPPPPRRSLPWPHRRARLSLPPYALSEDKDGP